MIKQNETGSTRAKAVLCLQVPHIQKIDFNIQIQEQQKRIQSMLGVRSRPHDVNYYHKEPSNQSINNDRGMGNFRHDRFHDKGCFHGRGGFGDRGRDGRRGRGGRGGRGRGGGGRGGGGNIIDKSQNRFSEAPDTALCDSISQLQVDIGDAKKGPATLKCIDIPDVCNFLFLFFIFCIYWLLFII